jgi:hypothetical protein
MDVKRPRPLKAGASWPEQGEWLLSSALPALHLRCRAERLLVAFAHGLGLAHLRQRFVVNSLGALAALAALRDLLPRTGEQSP